MRSDRARHVIEHDVRPERLGEVTGDEGGERRRHGGTCGRAADKRLGRRPDHDIGAQDSPVREHRRREFN
jgi:hypothetical protein